MKLVVIGAGGHASVVIEAAYAAGMEVLAILDDSPATLRSELFGVPVLGPISEVVNQFMDISAIIAIGDNRKRKTISSSLPLKWTSVIHPYSWISPSSSIGSGTIVCAGAIVQARTQVGGHSILNTACSIDHDCTIGEFAQISPGARLAGQVSLGEGAFVGTGAAVIPQQTIGAWSVVGAGAVVTRNVPDGCKVKGVPARA